MKITFLMPPALDGTRAADRLYGCNYGIYFLPHIPSLYCATLLADHSFQVSILDFAAQKKTIHDFIRFIENDNSEIYVFYTVFLSESTDLMARKLIREKKRRTKFVYLGTQPTWMPSNFIDKPDSFVIRGEPEFTLLELAETISSGKEGYSGINGLSFIGDGKITHNHEREPLHDLDMLPIPDRTLLDHSCYFNPKMRRTPHTAMLTSRGCFGQCWYCVPNSLSFARELEYKKSHKRKPAPRIHSPERVIEEFRQIKKLGFESVSIFDDLFIWGSERTIKICSGIEGLDMEWSCLTRPDTLTQEVADAMAAAGCIYVDLGVESFNQKILDSVGKGIRVDDIYNAVNVLKKAGMHVELNILMGATPEETESTIRETMDRVREIGADYVLFNIAAPFPGTEFYYGAREKGWLIGGEYRPVDPSKEAIISYPHLSKDKLDDLLSEAYRKYYFNVRYIARQLWHINSLKDLNRKTSAAIKMFKRNILKKI